MEEGTVQGVQRCLAVDSSSWVSIFQPSVVDNKIDSTIRALYGVTEAVLPVEGEQGVPFHMGKPSFSHTFLVCTLPTKASGILGMEFLEPRHAILDLKNCILTLSTTVKQGHKVLATESAKRRTAMDRSATLSFLRRPVIMPMLLLRVWQNVKCNH
jgi:hypothetical protein